MSFDMLDISAQKGPRIPIAVWADEIKYRQPKETFEQKCFRVAHSLSDNEDHFTHFYDALEDQRFLPGGRIQSAIGAEKRVTAFNCFVMRKVPDSLIGIMEVATEAARTMQMGGGVGYDFSAIRPKGSIIKSIGSIASGPVSFMGIMDAVCKTIASAGHRRGAQMACLRIDHPDVLEFINSKTNTHNLTQFNISVLITDAFMAAVKADGMFDLVFEGKVHDTVRARDLWDALLRATWDWAEPGVIFIDRINEMNNMWYLEDISATNPCGEQPLPEYGACLLGSFNMTKYLRVNPETGNFEFNWDLFEQDIPHVVRAMDNVIDQSIYPLPQQETEAKNKRRMGIGITGLGNLLGALGIRYGSKDAQALTKRILKFLANQAYKASALLAKEKGAFPLFDAEKYLKGKYIQKLDEDVKSLMSMFGMRNSHLISLAPTGTISLTANNISSSIEPVFMWTYTRKVTDEHGTRDEVVEDYAYREWGIKCETADQISVQEHVGMLTAAQEWVDSACSKTCNVGDAVTWEEFQEVYMLAYDGGAKGCTTFRASGKRFGILNATPASAADTQGQPDNENSLPIVENEGAACYIDPATGIRTCDSITA